MMKALRLGCALAALLAGALNAPPVLALDSGSQLRRFQDETRRRLDADRMKAASSAQQFASPSQAAAAASAMQIYVAGYEIHGVTRFADHEVAEVLKPFAGRTLVTADIHAAANALMRHYRKAGYLLAKVFVPPQQFGQVVRLDVEEGHLEPGGIEIVNKGERVNRDAVQAIVDRHLYTDRPLERHDLERAMLLADDLPGTRVSSIIYPGIEVGTARLRAVMSDEPQLAGNVDFDNFNNRAMGQERLGTTLYLNSPGGVGDQVVARLVTSGRGSNFGYLTYLRPVSGTGLRVGGSVDYFDYDAKLISGPGEVSGHASDIRLYATYPLIRSRHTNLNLRTDLSHARLVDRSRNTSSVTPPGVDPFGLSERRVNLLQVSLSGDETHDFLPNGTTLFEATAVAGSLDITGSDAHRAYDAAGPKTEGNFARFNFSLKRLQHLSGPWSLFGSLGGQFASRNLDPSQRIYLGGALSQAGYPVGEASGDQGAEINLELRRDFVPAWGGNLQAGLFYSQGWLRQQKSQWQAIENHESLKTTGIQLTQTLDSRWVLRGLAGWQVGGKSSVERQTGVNTDGRDWDYRVGVQVIRYFGFGGAL